MALLKSKDIAKMNQHEVQEKFRSLVDPVLSPDKAQQIVLAMESIEQLSNIQELVQLAVGSPEQRAQTSA